MRFNDGSRQLMFDKQRMFAVRLALKTGFLLYRIVWTKTWGSSLLQQISMFNKDERFEYRPDKQKNNLISHLLKQSKFISRGIHVLK